MKRVLFPLAALSLVAALVLMAVPGQAGWNSTQLPNGANLAVSIDDPETCTELLIPADEPTRDVVVSGTASLGLGEPDVTLVYVVDVSYSSIFNPGGDCGGDINGDGFANTVLDCECAGVLALNDAAVAGGSVDEVAIVVYGEGGTYADMTPAGGDDPITPPDADGNTNGMHDVDEVVTSAYSVSNAGCQGGVTQFTYKDVGCDGTNFCAALAATLTAVEASTNGYNIVVFLSDGVSNALSGGSIAEFNAILAALAETGAVAYTFAVGSASSCTGGEVGTLQQIADATGGECAAYDPDVLPDILPDLISTTLLSLGIEVDGGGMYPVSNDDIDPDLPHPGPVGVSYTTTVPTLGPGDHEICVAAEGSDTSGTATVTQCETIHLLQIALEPESDTNELGTPGQSHTVTATILGPASGEASVEGRKVLFDVLSGPNAGKFGAAITDSSGQATFTYIAEQGPDGLGTDTIQACFITANGDIGCDTAQKTWEDTTPPDVACVETVNPHGVNVPPAGKTTLPGPNGGQNEDGFYELIATDAVDPAPDIYVVDTGSGTVFGPFSSGTKIKYTESDEDPPMQKKMGSGNGRAGAIDWHIIGSGDACVFAVDFSDNQADCVSCLVPPIPK